MRAKRTDANHSGIAQAFERLGCSVWRVNDMVDLIVGYGGLSRLIEVKDGSKPPSKQKLTERATTFHKQWKGGVYLIRNVDDVFRCVYSLRQDVEDVNLARKARLPEPGNAARTV